METTNEGGPAGDPRQEPQPVPGPPPAPTSATPDAGGELTDPYGAAPSAAPVPPSVAPAAGEAGPPAAPPDPYAAAGGGGEPPPAAPAAPADPYAAAGGAPPAPAPPAPAPPAAPRPGDPTAAPGSPAGEPHAAPAPPAGPVPADATVAAPAVPLTDPSPAAPAPPADHGYAAPVPAPPADPAALPVTDPAYAAPAPPADPAYVAPSPPTDPGYVPPPPVGDPAYVAPSPPTDPGYAAPPPAGDPVYVAPSPPVDPGYAAPPPAGDSTYASPSPPADPASAAPAPPTESPYAAPPAGPAPADATAVAAAPPVTDPAPAAPAPPADPGYTAAPPVTDPAPAPGPAAPGYGPPPAGSPADGAAPAGPPPAGSGPDAPRQGSWALRITMALGILIVLGVLASVAVIAKSRGGPGPEPARADAEAFVRAWSAGDTAAMQALVDPPADVAADLTAALGALPVTKTTVTLGALTGPPENRTAAVTIELTAPELPPMTYPHAFTLRRVNDESWRVVWSRQLIHPELPPDGRFDKTETWAPRGTLLDAYGQPLSSTSGQVAIVLRPADVADRPGLEQALQATLGIDAATVAKAFTDARASGRAVVKTVPRAEYEKAKSAIYEIRGLRFDPVNATQGSLTARTEGLIAGRTGVATAEQAAALGAPYREGDEIGTSGLQASQQKTLGGLPATTVRIVDGAGTPVKELAKVDGSPPANVRTTFDPILQQKAEAALDSGAVPKGGALVVIDRNGGIKAMANKAGSTFNWATAQYPPGSTMKVVTAEALLAHGLRADTPLACPAQINAGGQVIRNFEGGAESGLNFTRAFAISCNTAFIGAAQQLSGDEMKQAAGRFGFNVDYDPGIPTKVRGSMPDDGAGAAKTSQAIGQGSVLSNPLHMASVAATAMTGRWLAPSFLADRPPTLPSGAPLDPRVLADLQTFMRACVESGSGKSAAAPGKVVHGKTGTAEFGTGPVLPTHAWFVGFAGDLAIALVVEGGGVGGSVAAPIAGRFFASV